MNKKSQNVINWRKRTKERIVKSMGGKCQICSYDKCLAALELHHLDSSEKEFGSIGNHMSQAAFDLGINGDVNDVSGKLMGLQSYGKVNPNYLKYLNQFEPIRITHNDVAYVFSIWDKDIKMEWIEPNWSEID